MKKISQINSFVQSILPIFSKPSQSLFLNLFNGWVLCPSRRFVTAIFQIGDVDGKHAHDAYHRFFRASAWIFSEFFQAVSMLIISLFGHPKFLWLTGDDTVHKKTGIKMNGAKSCRDAVRSTKKRVVYVWGLQIVLLCLLYDPPWGGEPLSLPINMRLYRKRPNKKTGKSILDLMNDMLMEVREWFPERKICFVGDGFYASMAGDLPPDVHIISRLRKDAALYGLPPKPVPGKRGRPRIKGKRLPTPEELAKISKKWRLVKTNERGKLRTRLVSVHWVVWHKVLPGKYVKMVISRDPTGREADDFFITTDLWLDPELVISGFAGRWSIEDTFRNAKQYLGIEQPQSWRNEGPEKVAAFGYAVYSIVWAWFIKHGNPKAFPERPWYITKTTPSFQDALAGIRHQIWESRISPSVLKHPEFHKFSKIMIESLARAA